MENFFFTLKSHLLAWLNRKPTNWVTNVIFPIFCAVTIFFVIWPFIQRKQSVPPLATCRNIHEGPRKSCRRSKRKTHEMVKICRDCQKELEEIRELVLTDQRHLRKHAKMKNLPDHKPPWPDPDSDEDAATVDSPPPPCPPPAQFAPARTFTRSPSSASFSTSVHLLQRTFTHSISHKYLSPPPPPPPPMPPLSSPFSEPRKPESFPPAPTASVHCTLISNFTQRESQARPLASIPNDSSPSSLAFWPASSIKTISDLGQSKCSGLSLSRWEMRTKTLTLPSSSPSKSQEEEIYRVSPGSLICREPMNQEAEAAHLSFINPDFRVLLETMVKKKLELSIGKRGRTREFSNGPLHSLGKVFASLGGEQDSTVWQSSWSMRSRSEQQLDAEKSPHPDDWRIHLMQTVRQLYWGLPILHSESLVAPVRFSDPIIRHPTTVFNPCIHITEKKVQESEPPHLELSQTLPNAAAPLHPKIAARSPCQSQTQMDTEIRPIFTPPCSQSGELHKSFPNMQNKAGPSFTSASQNRECHLLNKKIGSGRILPPIVPKPLKTFIQDPPDHLHQHSGESQAHWPVSVLPTVLDSPELQEKLEQLFHKRLLCNQEDKNVQLALSLKQTQRRLPEEHKAQDSHNGKNKQEKYSGYNCPHLMELENNLGQDLGHRVGQIVRNVFTGSANLPVETVDTKSMIRRRESLKLPTMDQHKKNLEKFLTTNLGKKGKDIKEHATPKDFQNSKYVTYHGQSNTGRKIAYLLSSEGQVLDTDETQGLSVLMPHFLKVLEKHIIKLQVRHRWLLPLKVLRLINILKIKKLDRFPRPQSVCASPPRHLAGPDWRVKLAKVSEKPSVACLGDRKIIKESGSFLPTLAGPRSGHLDIRNVRKHHWGSVQEFEGSQKKPPEPDSNIVLQDCKTGELLKDCVTDTLLQDCQDNVFLIADVLALEAHKSGCHSVPREDSSASQVLHDLTSSRKSSQGHQESSKLGQDNMSVPKHEKRDYKCPTVGQLEIKCSGQITHQAIQMSLSDPGQSVDISGKESSNLQEEKQEYPENYFKNKCKIFLQWLFPTKDKKPEQLQAKCSPTIPPAQKHRRQIKSRSLTAEAELIKVAVGNILEEKITLQQAQPAYRSSWCKEKHKDGHLCFRRILNYQEPKGMLLDIYPKHKDIPKDHVDNNKNEISRYSNLSPKVMKRADTPSEDNQGRQETQTTIV